MNIIPFSPTFWIVTLVLLIAGFVSYVAGKLTLAGSMTGVLVAVLIFIGSGLPGVVMLGVFFVLGTAVTSYKKEEKRKLDVNEAHQGRRKAGQVLANGGVSAALSLLHIVSENDSSVFLLMVASSLASATGDTFSSELGNVYGRNFFNILTFKKDQRGLNGVISFEGTFFGVVGSLAIAFVYLLFFGWSSAFFVIVLAGLAGNLFDSLLGALFERKGLLGNDAVNFLNTAFAALTAFLFLKL
jgi:uncharacterized protein (TIGR00297 family)